MQSKGSLSPVKNLTSGQLHEFIDSHPESVYVLIDVRQSEEYEQGHIPGARLISLNELDMYSEELKQLGDHTLIFYCRSGGRSARASAWASQVLGHPAVANLLGGFMGWEGPGLTGFPRLMSFNLNGTTEELLQQALELEKGTYQLYEQLAVEYPTGIVAEAISSLANAELAHAKAVHNLLSELSQASIQDFDESFKKVPGTIIENGLSFETVLDRARELGALGTPALLDLALEIEFGAYDLYKSLAFKVSSSEAQKALTELAQQEKSHADSILGVIGKIAGH
jgi:sulfur-carrier protein adenylyltransferase/sulfurtransferase